MMLKSYRCRIAAVAYQLAREDPELVLEFVDRLKTAGEIEPDELAHLERIARRWVTIARENRRTGRR